MKINRRQFVTTTAAGLIIPGVYAAANVKPSDRELIGKTICGYQGWFNAQGDGMDLGWRHYSGKGGKLETGRCTIDLWPDVSELGEDERYDTAFRHKDGSVAQVYNSASEQAIANHFDWMQVYGIDGVAIQRFGTNLRNTKLKAHHDAVIKHTQQACERTGRSWLAMYDLSGLKSGEPQQLIANDWRDLVQQRVILKDRTYLRHQGKPIVAIWGVGFRDDRQYTLADCAELIRRLSMDGRFSIMLGTPYYWREQRRDAIDNPTLHDVLKQADIISPWAVGRYANPETALHLGQTHVADDLAWCNKHRKHYLPVIFPGFSWHNLKKNKGENGKINQIPRLGGKFLWAQAEAARAAGVESLYLAMFDEMDEGTAIFKCTNNPPIGESPFITYEGLPSDHYLWLTGQIGKRLREGEGLPIESIPKRK